MLDVGTISKEPRIEVFNPYSRSRYYTDLTSARALIADRSGQWQGRRVILNDKSKVTWAVKQSGYAGPFVMQVVSSIVLFAMLSNISPRFFPGYHHLQNMPQPVWVTVERA